MKTIQLTKGYVALVDDSGFEYLNQFKWYAMKDHRSDMYYAARSKKVDGKWKYIFMHRDILNTPKGMVTDHKDRDGLNNQRSNLRASTKSQNALNSGSRINSTSSYKCVHWHKNSKQWRAVVTADGTKKLLGYFKTELEAAIIVNYAIRKYHGEYARPNNLIPVTQQER